MSRRLSTLQNMNVLRSEKYEAQKIWHILYTYRDILIDSSCCGVTLARQHIKILSKLETNNMISVNTKYWWSKNSGYRFCNFWFTFCVTIIKIHFWIEIWIVIIIWHHLKYVQEVPLTIMFYDASKRVSSIKLTMF